MSLSTFNFKNFSSKKVPAALLLSLLMFATVQWLIFNSPVFWRTVRVFANIGFDDPLLFEASLRLSDRENPDKKVFILGSSQAKQDYDLDYLHDRFAGQDVRFYNLGMAGTSQPVDMFMMKEKLVSHKPDVIIYMPFVASFYSGYKESGHNQIKYVFSHHVVPYLFTYLDRHEFWSYSDDFAQSLLGVISPFFKYREQINSVAANVYKHVTGVEPRNGPMKYHYTQDAPPEHFEQEIEMAQGRKFTVTPYTRLNQVLFEEFADYLKEHGVQLIVVPGPTNPRIGDIYDRKTIDPLFYSYLDYQQKRAGFLLVSDTQMPELEIGDFIDFSHLNEKGRTKFTAFIGDYLEQNLFPGHDRDYIENNTLTAQKR